MTPYGITRDLHLYLGVFSAPFVVVYALSTLALTRPTDTAAGPPHSFSKPVVVETSHQTGTLEHARDLLNQLGITGEIDYVSHQAREGRLVIPVTKPRERTTVKVNLARQEAAVETRSQSLMQACIYLHKMPGPHNVKFRGNWFGTVWWARLADFTVLGLFILSGSGLYLWWKLKGERKLGWALLAAGSLMTLLLVAAICNV